MQSLGRINPMRRDPAPSRWQYRMQRLWLTPYFRLLFRVGAPMLIAGLAAQLVLHDDARRAAIVQSFADIRQKFEARPEFRVDLLSVEGASADLADAVRAKLALNLPQSSFHLDLDALRAKIESLDAVASVEVRVRSGGVLQVVLTERVPVAVWRTETGLQLLDGTGHRVAGLGAREDRGDLPLVAGQGADKAMDEALAILAAAAPLTHRVRGLIRVGDRRWDIVLDRNERIELPAENPVAAVERLLALDQAEKLLDRDLTAIDLRNQDRPILRLAPFALNELRRAQGLAPTTESNL